ncbi:MAG: methyltransferase domain-containing protein, partial [Candidatus Hydrogenedentes bacterium]|nr:methyltransferase domain-containing protein [Candidatus Hydrogenedentota bacterium]
MTTWGTAGIAVVCAVLAVSIAWRFLSRVGKLPCPTWLAWMLELNFMEKHGGQSTTIDALELRPGLRVADIGCGPGRLTFRIGEAVGPDGEVVALDMQPRMLERVRARISERGVSNVMPLLSGAGDGKLPQEHFDRAL